MIPLISVILPFHKQENEKYLRQTIKSLRMQNELTIEVIIVLTEGVTFEGYLPNNFKTYTMPGKSTFAKKMNYGVRLSDPRSQFIMLLSDDVVLSDGCLKAMAESCDGNHVIVNPMSNCDNERLYFTPIPWKQVNNLEDVNVEEILFYKNRIDLQVVTDAVCFYATMIPRATWDLVGELDEAYDTGCEDTDYCMRAKKLGIPCMITFRAFAFHFVGKTSSEYCTKEITEANHDLFAKKWGFRLVPKI